MTDRPGGWRCEGIRASMPVHGSDQDTRLLPCVVLQTGAADTQQPRPLKTHLQQAVQPLVHLSILCLKVHAKWLSHRGSASIQSPHLQQAVQALIHLLILRRRAAGRQAKQGVQAHQRGASIEQQLALLLAAAARGMAGVGLSSVELQNKHAAAGSPPRRHCGGWQECASRVAVQSMHSSWPPTQHQLPAAAPSQLPPPPALEGSGGSRQAPLVGSLQRSRSRRQACGTQQGSEARGGCDRLVIGRQWRSSVFT